MKVVIKQILCPVDFSATADLASRYAVALAEANGAIVTLLHVVAPVIAALPGETVLPDLAQANIDELAEACRERLAKTVGDLAVSGVTLQYRVVSGVPFVEIIRVAREMVSDLIVMGSHGRTGLGHLLIGSVAERVVRKAPCPVLTVRDPQHQFIMP